MTTDVRLELPRLEWSRRYSVGVAEIDAQHEELFRRINAFIAAAEERRARPEVESLVVFLGEYAKQHFADEERMMQFSGFPGLGAHLEQHQAFIREWTRLAHRLADEGTTIGLAQECVALVFEWANVHVPRSDVELGAWLRRLGLGPSGGGASA